MMQIDNATLPTASSGNQTREWVDVRILDPARDQGPDLDAALAGDDPPLPLSPPPQPWPRIFPGI